MKKGILLLLVFSSFFAQAQSLKEALFSGKLRNEPGTVIRKGDDLSTKMDTVARKEPARDTLAVITVAQPHQPEPAQKRTATSDVTSSNTTAAAPSQAAPATTETTQAAEQTETGESTAAAEPEPEVKIKPKDNRALFKEYMTSLAATVKSEVLSNKKIKKGIYYVTIAYTIETDGQVTITDLVVDPKQELLQKQIKERMELDMPVLNPELNSSGVARKVNRRYNFSLDKE